MIAEEIEPLGPSRDDMRASINTVELISALTGAEIESLSSIAEAVRNYLVVNQPKEERTLTPEEAKELRSRITDEQ